MENMALTIMEVYKILPKSNCKECGFPTCMAFAMQVTAMTKNLEDCPKISSEAQEKFSEASAAPMKLVKVGTGNNVFEFGQETVMFRHEKKFYNPCGIAVRIPASLSDEEMLKKIDKINKSEFFRVGKKLKVSLTAVEVDNCSQPDARARLASERSSVPLVLIGTNPSKMNLAVDAIKAKKPLIYKATPENIDSFIDIAAQAQVPLAICGNSLEETADLVDKARNKKIDQIALAFDSKNPAETIKNLTITRRAALTKNFRSFGYPAIVNIEEQDEEIQSALASAFAVKYAGIVIVDTTSPEALLPVLTAIGNIYTDPQVPNAVESKLYEIGSPNENSPVMFTTNFSLTYFSVAGEVERSKIPAYICVVDTEGLGVLNSYAGDKISVDKVVKTMKEQKVAEKVKHRKLIIPGLLAIFKGEIEDISEWKVIVGTENARGIPALLHQLKDKGTYDA
ncbi:MAG: acetyl-CoA decarbonylase/synthase complex subunit gamma [Ruminiclostridium sp.]|nr:acetyl-CoA decarbonylase/synthase complex subunit gamma [Ruminiclostridium sp.]